VSSYTADDLFHQDALQDAVLGALRDLVAASTGLSTALVVGAPLRADGLLFNCAVVVCEGTVRGVVPKSYLPNYREFYEKRYFAAARDTAARQIRLLGQDVAFGPDLLFDAEGLDDFSFHVEICEDLWVPVPPSTWAALAGATVLVNLSASNRLDAALGRPPGALSQPRRPGSGHASRGEGPALLLLFASREHPGRHAAGLPGAWSGEQRLRRPEAGTAWPHIPGLRALAGADAERDYPLYRREGATGMRAIPGDDVLVSGQSREHAPVGIRRADEARSSSARSIVTPGRRTGHDGT